LNPNSSEAQAELFDDFYSESEEHLKNIREALLLLEQSLGKSQPDSGVMEELFRSFHSFKGISAIVGLRTAEELAHAAEEFLRQLTQGRVSVSLPAVEVLMNAAGALEQIVAAFRAKSSPPAHEGILKALGAFRGPELEAEEPRRRVDGALHDSAIAHQFEEAHARGLLLWRCIFVPSRELDERGININSVRARLSRAGEILRSTPQVRGEGAIAFEFLVGMKETPADIASWEGEGISVELLEHETLSAGLEEKSERKSGETHSPFIAPSHVVRVDLNRLDELMRITGEMVIHRSRLEELLNRPARGGAALDQRGLQEVNGSLNRSLRELREAIMRVRLVPVAEIFARMPFVVRDLTRDSNKEVRLKLEGQQTEVDKHLIERLKDPLLHLVRNALSHGVESKLERGAAGKPVEATIALRASTAGDSVLIQISDDGRGIDRESVKRRAHALGMEVPSPLDNTALLKILCSPGFSTRMDADRASGRGVGMDVVYSTVRELGGSVSVQTEPGKGTQFTLRLPLTLAIAETFIVSAAEQTCAVPQSSVTEILHIHEDQIRTVNRVEVVPYRSGVLPVVRLSSLFQLKKGAAGPTLVLLVLSSERGSTGLVVEKVHGQKEIVVRAMRDPLIQVPGIAGATELGDGRPVLILDASVLTSGPIRPHDATNKQNNGAAHGI
jgi:two-component system chemotaxis sensor kinase CheA